MYESLCSSFLNNLPKLMPPKWDSQTRGFLLSMFPINPAYIKDSAFSLEDVQTNPRLRVFFTVKTPAPFETGRTSNLTNTETLARILSQGRERGSNRPQHPRNVVISVVPHSYNCLAMPTEMLGC